jgi:NADH dehydrogenase
MEARQTNSPTKLPRVVVIGAGFGGIEVAKHLGQAPVRVTVIDRNNHHLFQPLLYQVATAYLSPADITAPIRHVLRKQVNTEVMLAEVMGIDVEHRLVLVRDPTGREGQPVPYDYLVVATGAGQSYFGHDEWAEFAPGLKSITDATNIRRRVLLSFEEAEAERDLARQRALLTFVVVGGGPTGVEMAGAIAELAHHSILTDFRHIQAETARVLLVEAMERILPAFPESLARKAARKLRRLGVEIRTRAPVEAVDASGVVIAGEHLPARTVIWAAGVRASPAGAWLGAETDRAGRVIVRDDLTLQGHPEIFVLGDVANVAIMGKPLPGLAPVAMQQGRYVAEAIRRRLAHLPTPSFRYRDKGNLATVGRAFAIVDFGWLRMSGFLAWLAWLGVHIAYLIGFRNRVVVLFQWAWSYFTSQRGARLITPDELTRSSPVESPTEPAPQREERREAAAPAS